MIRNVVGSSPGIPPLRQLNLTEPEVETCSRQGPRKERDLFVCLPRVGSWRLTSVTQRNGLDLSPVEAHSTNSCVASALETD